MDQSEDFVVIEEEPIHSPEQAMQKLYLLINTFNSSIDAVNQSNILLKDELRLALDVTLQNIKPETATDSTELINAFESKLTGSDDIRQNYIKHILSRLVSVNVQNQAFQDQIEGEKNANELRKRMIWLKLQDAMSSVNAIQSALCMTESTLNHHGDVSQHDDNTPGDPILANYNGEDTEEARKTTHSENRSLSDEEISAILNDLCNRLSAVQLRVTEGVVTIDGNPPVRSGGQTKPEACVETSSFFTVDEPLLSPPQWSAISPPSDINSTPNPPAGNEEPKRATSPSSPGGDVSRCACAIPTATFRDATPHCESLDPAKLINPEQKDTYNSMEAVCQWVDTLPTRLIPETPSVVQQASNANAVGTVRPDMEVASGSRPIIPQASNSNDDVDDSFIGTAMRKPKPRRLMPTYSADEAVGESVDFTGLLKPKPRRFTPTFSADEEIPWCPCCNNRFASRQALEDHLNKEP